MVRFFQDLISVHSFLEACASSYKRVGVCRAELSPAPSVSFGQQLVINSPKNGLSGAKKSRCAGCP
jgi:hypothetical protein